MVGATGISTQSAVRRSTANTSEPKEPAMSQYPRQATTGGQRFPLRHLERNSVP